MRLYLAASLLSPYLRRSTYTLWTLLLGIQPDSMGRTQGAEGAPPRVSLARFPIYYLRQCRSREVQLLVASSPAPGPTTPKILRRSGEKKKKQGVSAGGPVSGTCTVTPSQSHRQQQQERLFFFLFFVKSIPVSATIAAMPLGWAGLCVYGNGGGAGDDAWDRSVRINPGRFCFLWELCPFFFATGEDDEFCVRQRRKIA